eukprot:932097-Pyramimonas_sp.AAC.1
MDCSIWSTYYGDMQPRTTKAWNLAQLMMEALKISRDVVLGGSARNLMWETSGLLRLESVAEIQ